MEAMTTELQAIASTSGTHVAEIENLRQENLLLSSENDRLKKFLAGFPSDFKPYARYYEDYKYFKAEF